MKNGASGVDRTAVGLSCQHYGTLADKFYSNWKRVPHPKKLDVE